MLLRDLPQVGLIEGASEYKVKKNVKKHRSRDTLFRSMCNIYLTLETTKHENEHLTCPQGTWYSSGNFPFRFASPFNILIMADDKIWKHQNILRNPKGIWELVFVLSFQRLCVYAFAREYVVPWGIYHVVFTRPLPHRLGYFLKRLLLCPVIVPHPDVYPSSLPIMTYTYFSVSVDGREG